MKTKTIEDMIEIVNIECTICGKENEIGLPQSYMECSNCTTLFKVDFRNNSLILTQKINANKN